MAARPGVASAGTKDCGEEIREKWLLASWACQAGFRTCLQGSFPASAAGENWKGKRKKGHFLRHTQDGGSGRHSLALPMMAAVCSCALGREKRGRYSKYPAPSDRKSAFSWVWAALRSQRVPNYPCASPVVTKSVFPEWLQLPACGGKKPVLENGRKAPVGCCVLGGRRTLARWLGQGEPLNLSWPCQELWCLSCQTQTGPDDGGLKKLLNPSN